MSLINKNANRLAIIGRPNVGKSTLFNILTGTRKAVVKDMSGVTRDIQIEPGSWLDKKFDVIDTGGVTDAEDVFSKLIKEQVLSILGSVDCLIVVVDGRAGLCPEDKDLIRVARESNKPFAIAVNKVDDPSDEEWAKGDFYQFGEELFATSFEQRRGISELLEWCTSNFKEQESYTIRQGTTIAVIGKPNAGKSSLVNHLLGENRMLVSDIAGTTVDAIDSEFTYNGKDFVLIDTAGLRKKSKRIDHIEKIAGFKSEESVKRADIVLLMVDALLGPSVQDAKMLEMILKHHKAVILVGNKSDIGEREVAEFRKGFREITSQVFHFYDDLPITFISAKTGAGIKKLFEKIEEVSDKLSIQISTGELNRFFFDVIRQAPAPVYGHRNVKFYYLTQTSQKPPSFIAFANFPDGVNNSYRRFLIKRIKAHWGLEGIPIRIFVMKTAKKSKKAKNYADAMDAGDEFVVEYEIPENWQELAEEQSLENLKSEDFQL